jgi:hypothetical protein
MQGIGSGVGVIVGVNVAVSSVSVTTVSISGITGDSVATVVEQLVRINEQITRAQLTNNPFFFTNTLPENKLKLDGINVKKTYL